MLVLVVGASGVVGRQLVPQLLDAGHAVVSTTRSSPPPAAAERLEHRRLDLLDAAAVTALVHEVRPDAIVHQATALSRLTNNLRRFDSLFALTNQLRTAGTANLIAASRDCGWPRLLVQSFCGWPWACVGGPVKTEDDPLETDPPRPSGRRCRPSSTWSSRCSPTTPAGWCCATAGSTVPAAR